MGLPAFDMSAFEAAQRAVTSEPRATTTVFLAPRLNSSTSSDEAKEQVRASTDSLIEAFTSWRAGALQSMAELPQLIESACRSQSLDRLRLLSDRLTDLLKNAEDDRKAHADMDDENIRAALSLTGRTSQISADTGRFVRREIRRVEQMAKARAAAYEKILARTKEAKERLDGFIASQSLQAAFLPEQQEKAGYMESALHRPADIEGVRERTARRLKQFPKTAAYLAR